MSVHEMPPLFYRATKIWANVHIMRARSTPVPLFAENVSEIFAAQLFTVPCVVGAVARTVRRTASSVTAVSKKISSPLS